MGVVTFLFTDVEGSTKLLHELGDEYAAALQEHRRLLREAFHAHDGVEVDTQGDAFFVAFARVSDAVASAAAAQKALVGGPIKVRMGIHSGEPRLTEEGYVGFDVHKGAPGVVSEPPLRRPRSDLAAEGSAGGGGFAGDC